MAAHGDDDPPQPLLTVLPCLERAMCAAHAEKSPVIDKATLTFGVRGSGPGAGKDAVADFISELLAERGIVSRREAFATPLRECLEILTGVTVAESRTTEGKERVLPGWDMTVGRMLQLLGTDAIRDNLHAKAWLMALFRRFADDEVVVISDVRFPNEESVVRARAGIIVQVTRPTSVAPEDTVRSDGRSDQHASERALVGSKADYVIVNDGTLDDLRDRVRDLVETLVVGGPPS